MLGFVELIRFGAGAIRATPAAVAAGGRRCAVCERVGRSGGRRNRMRLNIINNIIVNSCLKRFKMF